jgi:hypothetical protein
MNITKLDALPLDFSLHALGQYQSSPGTFRGSCIIRGVTMLWYCEERLV